MSNHDVEPTTAPSADHPPSNNEHEKLPAEAPSLVPPEPATVQLVPREPAAEHRRPISDRRREANRLNAQKSTGPRTEAGKQRASQNARLPVRLLGLAEARTLNQDVNAAGKLYRRMIAPYEPAPPLLARQFEDLARLYLELEACERMRDAQLEDRWEQSDIERREAFFEMDRDLQGTTEEIFEKGLCRQPDCPAKFKRLVDTLSIVKDHLLRRDYDLDSMLHYLYGKDLNPPSDRGQTICMGCQKLMDPEKVSSITDVQIQRLLGTVEEEEDAAVMAYALLLDQKSISRAGRLARLAPNRDDHWMNRQLERLRHDIDRKLKLILTLLEMFGFEQQPRHGRSPRLRRGSGAPEGGSQGGPNTDSNADSDAGSNASADGRPRPALPPDREPRRGGPPRPPSPSPKPPRRSGPARHRVKRDKSRHGRTAVAGGSRSAAVGCRPLTHPPRRVRPLPAVDGRCVQEVAASDRAESQPFWSFVCRRASLTPSGVSPLRRGEGLGVRGICASAKRRNVRASKGVRCAQKIFKGTQEISCNQQIDPKMGQNEANENRSRRSVAGGWLPAVAAARPRFATIISGISGSLHDGPP